jgi:alpha-N-acetylglucosaminidase
MGGKTAYTGILDFYASDIFKALKSPAKGRLVGYGFAPEGTENNEVIYELMSDLAWKTDPVKLDDWIQDYCTSRYGGYPESMRTAWDLYRKTCYGTFTDHPGFGWQTGSCSHGSVNRDPRFLDGVQAFLACAGQLGKSPLYQGDAIEQSAIALGLKADDWFILARQAHDIGDNAIRDQAAARGLELLTEADRLLESHPLHRLQRWIDFARAHGDDAAQKKAYEANARRLITVWGPPINDYSRRLWSGLIRDFYRERMRLTFAGLKSGQGFNRGPWEEAWVRAPGVSPCAPYANPLAEAARLVAKACTEPMPKVRELRRETIGDWAPGQVSTEWKTVEWRISTEQLRKLKAIQFNYTGGGCRLDAQWVALVADGKEIARDAHFGFAGIPDSQNVYKLKAPAGLQANNDCLIRASVRTDGGTNSRGSVLLLFD